MSDRIAGETPDGFDSYPQRGGDTSRPPHFLETTMRDIGSDALPDRRPRGDHAETASPRDIHVAETRELGILPLPTQDIITRDGGNSAIIGKPGNERIVYYFGDTLRYDLTMPGDPWKCITNTVATARLDNPLVLKDFLEENSDPKVFVDYTPAEKQFQGELRSFRKEGLSPSEVDEKYKRDGDLIKRIAIWPGSLISDGEGGGYAFNNHIDAQSGDLRFFRAGVSLAHVSLDGDDVSATRLPGLLFRPPEPSFANAMVDGDKVYVYGQFYSSKPASTPHTIARVSLDQVTQREAYEFWNGSGWTKDVKQASPIMSGIPDAVTVSYNEHLGCYLAVHSLPLDNRVAARTAPRPEGPWSEPELLFRGIEGGDSTGADFNYAGIEHPGLSSEGGKRIVCSYYNPQEMATGKLRLVEVTFA